MSKRPWMPLYIADYLRKTTHLSALESGAYLHLIMDHWQNGGLPSDDKQLARIAKMTDTQWRKARPVLAAFFSAEWKHERVEQELAKAADITVKRRAAAEEKHRLYPAKGGANAGANAPAKADTLHTTHYTSEQASKSEAVAVRAPELCRAIVKAFERANSPSIPDTSRVDLWLSQGYEPSIILAAVTTLVVRKPSISSLSYFDAAIREAHEMRAPKPRAPAAINWDTTVAAFKTTGNWPRSAPGSEPGMAGCQVPAEILRKHGFDPAGATLAPAAERPAKNPHEQMAQVLPAKAAPAENAPRTQPAPLCLVETETTDDVHWLPIKTALVDLLGADAVSTWFGDARVVSLEGELIVIAAGSKTTIAKWEGHLLSSIGGAVRLAYPTVTEFKFVVSPLSGIAERAA